MSMTAFNLQDWLKKKEQDWATQKEEAKKPGTFAEIPDGLYLARLESVEAGLSKSSDRPQIMWVYVIIDGEQRGQFLRDFDGLDREDALMWLARKLARFGIDPSLVNAKDIPSVLEALSDWSPEVQLQAVTKKGFQNVRIRKVLSSPPTGAGARYFGEGVDEDEETTTEEAESASVEEETSVPETDETEEGGEGEVVVPEKGMKVRWTRKVKGKDTVTEGVISEEVGEEDTEISVESGGKTYQVSLEDESLELVEE